MPSGRVKHIGWFASDKRQFVNGVPRRVRECGCPPPPLYVFVMKCNAYVHSVETMWRGTPHWKQVYCGQFQCADLQSNTHAHELMSDGMHSDGMYPSDFAYCCTTELRTIRRNALTAVSSQQVAEFLTTVAERIGGNASRSRLQSGEPVTIGPATAEPISTKDETWTAQMILDKLCGELRAMREGEGRNAALNIAAVQMGELSAGWGIPRQPIADALLLAMQENGYVAKDGLHETKETLASGFKKGLSNLRTEVRRIRGISLLIIDPIVSAVVGDINKANDVRRSLQPIVDFAAEFDCAVLGITHFGKATAGRKSAERVIGSQAFAALARMVLATAKEEESDMRVLIRSKSNISADEGGVIYTIEPIEVKAGNGATIQTTRVVWGSSIQGTSRSILSSVESEDTERCGKKMDEAKNCLSNTVGNGPIPVKQVQQLARNEHIAHVTLQRVKNSATRKLAASVTQR